MFVTGAGVMALLLAAPPGAPVGGVAELIGRLKDRDPVVREEACHALASLGAAAKPAVPDLIDALGDDHLPVYVAAGFALAEMGKDAVPALMQAARSRNTGVRAEAAYLLGRIGPDAIEAVPTLVEAMGGGDPEVREAAVTALGQIFDSSPASDPAPPLDLGSSTIPGLLNLLARTGAGDPSWSLVRSEAAKTLGKIGPSSSAAVPALVGYLRDPDPRVRAACAWALGGGFLEPTPNRWMMYRTSRSGIGVGAEQAVPGLIEALDDPEATVQWNAAEALAGFGPAARAAIPKLRRIAVVEPAGDVSPLAPAEAEVDDGIIRVPVSGPILTGAAPSRPQGPHSSVVRLLAALSLHELGEISADDTILKLLREDGNGMVRELAAMVLGHLRLASAVPALTAALNDVDRQVREAAAVALERIEGDSPRR
jgi:HEAT repeat protein